MAFDELLAGRIRFALSRRKNIDEKKMFGGICFFLNGNILVGVWKDSLIARVGPECKAAALKEPSVKPFDVTGTPMKGWVLVEPAGLESDDELKAWIDRCIAFVKTLPKKA